MIIVTVLLLLNFHRITEIFDRGYKIVVLRKDYDLIPKTTYNFEEEYERNSKIEDKEVHGIQNNIFQIFIGEDLIPLEIHDNILFLKNNNPEWKYYLIMDKNINHYLDNLDPEYVSIYHEISSKYPAAKADLLRYLLIEKYGGLYIDIKSTCTKKLDEVINTDKIMIFKWCIISTASLNICGIGPARRKRITPHEFVQWILIYPKGHTFLREVLKNINNKYHEYKDNKELEQNIFAFTGPDMYTDTISPLMNEENSVLIPNFIDKSFVYSYLKYFHKCYVRSVNYSNLSDKIIN